VSVAVSNRSEVAAAVLDDRRLDLAAVWIPAAIALVLCFVDLTSRSLGLDEAATASIAAQHGGALGSAIARDGGNMSAYYVLMHVLVTWFGNGTLLMRLLSAVSIVAASAVVGAIGMRLFDRRVAFAAGLLTAVSLPLVFWGQDARAYAPMVALVCGSFLGFVWLASDAFLPSWRAPRGAWATYFVCTTLAAYFSFVSVLVIPAQLIMLWWRRRAIRPVLVSLALSVICWIPLIVLALRRGSSQLFWVPRLSLVVYKQVLESLSSAGLQPTFRGTATLWPLIVVTVAIVCAVAVVHVRRASRPAPRPNPFWGQGVVLLWLAVPIVLALLESVVAQPTFTARNLLMCVPAVALVVAVGLCDPRLPRGVGWAALAGVIVLRVLALAPAYGVSPEDWRQASSYVLAHAQPGDCVAFYPLDARMPFEYYVGRRGGAAELAAPRSVLPAIRWGETKPFVELYSTLSPARLGSVRASCRRLWLVSAHEGQPHGPSAESRANWARFLALRAALEQAYPGHERTQFSYSATIHVDLLRP
jgi:uncharacterized membrane protein